VPTLQPLIEPSAASNRTLTGLPEDYIMLADVWIGGAADGLDIAPFIEAVLMS